MASDSSSPLDKVVKTIFPEGWASRSDPKKIYLKPEYMSPGRGFVEIGKRSVYDLDSRSNSNASILLAEFNSRFGEQPLAVLQLCSAVQAKRDAKLGRFFILRPIQSDSFEIVGFFSTEDGKNLSSLQILDVSEIWDPPMDRLFFFNNTHFTDLIACLLFTSEQRKRKNQMAASDQKKASGNNRFKYFQVPSTVSAYTWNQHILDYANNVWTNIEPGLEQDFIPDSRFVNGLSTSAVFMRDTTNIRDILSCKRLLTEPELDYISRRKWRQFVCLFSHGCETALAVPLLDTRCARELLSLKCFHPDFSRLAAERCLLARPNSFMIRVPERYWMYGCFAITWRDSRPQPQHMLISWHINGNHALLGLDEVGMPCYIPAGKVPSPDHEDGFFYEVQTGKSLAGGSLEVELLSPPVVFGTIMDVCEHFKQCGIDPLEDTDIPNLE